MTQHSFRSRCFAGVAVLSGVGAALAVNGAGFVPLKSPPSAAVGARVRIDPNAPLKPRSLEALSATHDPFSHLVRLAALYPGAGGGGVSGGVSLSLGSAWTRPIDGADGAAGADRLGERMTGRESLEGGLVNLTFDVDALFGAPRWGN